MKIVLNIFVVVFLFVSFPGYCTLADNSLKQLKLELKKEGTSLLKKRGNDAYGYPAFASDHIREQYEMIEELRARKYKAEFAIGFDEAKKIIDQYLK